MLLALFVENIIAVEAIGALLSPLLIFAAIVFAGLYIGPRDGVSDDRADHRLARRK